MWDERRAPEKSETEAKDVQQIHLGRRRLEKALTSLVLL